MKKRLIGVSVFAVLSLLVAGCGGGDDTSVYLVFDIGGRGDQSFNDAAATGLDQATEELGISASELEPTSGGRESGRVVEPGRRGRRTAGVWSRVPVHRCHRGCRRGLS